MLDEKRVSRQVGWWLVVGIIILSVLWCAYGASVRADDDPIICVDGEPCIGPAVTAQATPTATPVMAPSPASLPVITRPFPLGPCKIAPGCVLLPIARTP